MNRVYISGIIQKIYPEKQTTSGAKYKRATFSFCVARDTFRVILVTFYENHFHIIKEGSHFVIEGKLSIYGDYGKEKQQKTEITVFNVRELINSPENKTAEKLDVELQELAVDFYKGKINDKK